MNLAVVSPWPPQQTGIADYTYNLCKDLLNLGYEISIVTQANNPRPLKGALFLEIDEFIARHLKFDNIIYHIGNNSNFHIFQIYLIKITGGTVHLHDLHLHHLMAWILYVNGNTELYSRIISKWYGPSAGDKAVDYIYAKEPIWDNESIATKYPFFEEVLQYADSLIVHSDFAKKAVTDIFNIPSLKIYQLYDHFTDFAKNKEDGVINIGIFGGVSTNKRVDIILKACERINNQAIKLKINIAGSIDHDCRHLIDYPKKLGIGDIVEFHGRVDENTFEYLFMNSDICVVLRHPSMGETSAIAMRAIINEIPLIVSDIAWYKELPDFVEKVSVGDNEVDELERSILKLCNFETRLNIKRKMKEFSAQYLSKDKLLKEYIDFLKENKI